MCRIAGIVSALDFQYDVGCRLAVMLESLSHGGPDDSGVFINQRVAFGHRRLAIIDTTTAGHQPMVTLDSEVIISFNGEIYNYQILKKELEALGIVFQTKTDTEVILNAYKQWGIESFNRFHGIFAFALYDKRNNRILLVRDQQGVKPLYYLIDGDKLIFASEVRAFKAFQHDWPENEDWKILFLAFGSLPTPSTTLAGVYQLFTGTYLEVDLENFTSQLKPYACAASTDQYSITTYSEALEKIRPAVSEALKKNLISDAPLGIFLSGGVDSSLLTLLADQLKIDLKTLSVNFDDAAFDERPFQKQVLEKTRHITHVSYTITEKMFWDQLDDIWKSMDQPSIDGVNSYFVSQYAKKEGLKVVLSGLGADEIFGGYKSISRIHWIEYLRFLPFKNFISKLIGYNVKAFRRLVFLKIPGAIGDYLFLRGIHTPEVIARLLGVPEEKVWQALKKVTMAKPAPSDPMEYVSYLESEIYMTNQLLKDADYMGMWHGIEIRVPFLDSELIKTLKSTHPSIRHKKGWTKFLLTASFVDLLPPEIIFREKIGFTFPFSVWLKNTELFKRLITKGPAEDQIVVDFESGREHWSKCWSLAVLQRFK